MRENEDIFLGDGVRGASLLLRGRGLRWLLGGTVRDWHMPIGNALISAYSWLAYASRE